MDAVHENAPSPVRRAVGSPANLIEATLSQRQSGLGPCETRLKMGRADGAECSSLGLYQ